MFVAVRQRLLSAREVASKPWPGQRERLGTVRQSDSHGCVMLCDLVLWSLMCHDFRTLKTQRDKQW